LGELEQIGLDLKASDSENLSADRQDRGIPLIEPEVVIGDRFAALSSSDLSESEQNSVKRLSLEVLAEKYKVGTVLTSPASVREYLQLKLSECKAENFGAVFFDNRHRVLRFEEMFQGTIDEAQVHPRVVVQRALTLNAAAVILYHNHPSGVAEPSREDVHITSRLKDALSLVDVRVLDHFVVGAEAVTSFSELGLL
jgi:DNA repair protein RadC